MRAFGVLATALACASAGLLAAARPEAGQADGPKTETRKKTVIVEQQGDDGAGPDAGPWTMGLLGGPGVRIGVTVANLDEDQAKTTSGVVVTAVRDDSPAAKAGIREKDIITSFDGEKVRSAAQITRLVSETPPGHTVPVTALRDGKAVNLQVTPQVDQMAMNGPRTFRWRTPEFGNRDMAPPRHDMPEGRFFHMPAPEHDGPGNRFFFHTPGDGDDDTFDMFVAPGSRGRLGIGIEDLTPQLAEFFGAKDGVLVTSVTADSPAAKAGMRAGDVITAIGDKPVTSAAELVAAVRRVDDGGDVRITYTRDKKSASLTAKLEVGDKDKPKMKRRGEPV